MNSARILSINCLKYRRVRETVRDRYRTRQILPVLEKCGAKIEFEGAHAKAIDTIIWYGFGFRPWRMKEKTNGTIS